MATITTKYIETLNYHYAKRSAILTTLENILNTGQDAVTKSEWSSLRDFAKSTILKMLERVDKGQLVIESLGKEYKFGKPFIVKIDGHAWPLSAKVIVKEEHFWTRMLLHADFGFADAFMMGEVEVDKLKDVFKIFVLNRKSIGELSTLLTPVVRAVSYM
ncbi:hypothetical protein BDN70DRAFT_938458 [Pholiota conissans]|uniref:Uncharacterized protein n=1 Tax=Pholiota conissans TaxID=109636 RepID=A0A9P6CMS0_9AGAR|nr:hypothetical protein BDN70DRAFT_938458 [Pholiota conissans]